jgi:hypothetical protein
MTRQEMEQKIDELARKSPKRFLNWLGRWNIEGRFPNQQLPCFLRATFTMRAGLLIEGWFWRDTAWVIF